MKRNRALKYYGRNEFDEITFRLNGERWLATYSVALRKVCIENKVYN